MRSHPRSTVPSHPAARVTLLAFLFLGGCASPPPVGDGNPPEPGVDFVTEVKPILQERCVMCHNRAVLPDRTSFETGELAMKGDSRGPVILPGDAAGSRFMAAISSPDYLERAMPPVSHRVAEDEVALLRRWIDAGAPWPTGPEGRIVPDRVPLE